MNFSTIQFHPGPRVASIVLNRPPMNVINIEMMEELRAAWNEVEGLKAQVVVISGAGDQAFSAGVDVADHAPKKVERMLSKFHKIIRTIYETDRATIAAIHGHTLGGGSELAMVCDLVVAADNAQIGQPEIALGCYPPVAAAMLPRAIGFHRASEMVLLGERITAGEAHRIGLVNKVVQRSKLNEAVDGYVEALLKKSSVALKYAKHALRDGVDHRFAKALDRTEKLYLERLTSTADMKEGIEAFINDRPPDWKNR